MEASDLMERNQEKILSNHNVCSYNPFSEEWKELKDQEQDVLERLVEREMFRDLMSVLTEKQKKAVTFVLSGKHEAGRRLCGNGHRSAERF